MSFLKYVVMALVAVGFVTAKSAHAEDMSAKQAESATQNTLTVTEPMLDAFAQSAIKVGQIQQKMAPQISQAEAEEQKKQIFQDMQQQMIGAIQSTEGITVQEYNQISLQARQDDQLAMQIQDRIKSSLQ